MVIEGDNVLLFAADKRPSPALWRAIYDARYGRDVMDRLQAGSVAICGLGGLGALVALELGRLGVGRLLLIDGDVVRSNESGKAALFCQPDWPAQDRRAGVNACGVCAADSRWKRALSGWTVITLLLCWRIGRSSANVWTDRKRKRCSHNRCSVNYQTQHLSAPAAWLAMDQAMRS